MKVDIIYEIHNSLENGILLRLWKEKTEQFMV